MKKTILLFVLLLSIIRVSAQKERFNIPEDFGKTESTVLITEGARNKITESMVEAFEKEYKGNFEAITGTGKYSNTSKYDASKYRYVFYVLENYNPGYFVGRDRFPPTTDWKFGILDRQTGKSYEQDFWSGNFKKGSRNYVKNLEEMRKKNAGN